MGGLILTTYPFPLSPPSVYYPTPELGAELIAGVRAPSSPLTLSPWVSMVRIRVRIRDRVRFMVLVRGKCPGGEYPLSRGNV